MSRRPPNPNAERAAQNQQTLKTLVKIESNKSCADCKRNKHPRWASWSLGVFLCIRCSGIHRGMGTHISRVKSVDLDAWTDEQVQNMIRWGNARANKYWEAKLSPGHVPADAKMENFIRTKYDSKRWVMDGGMPDPATLNVEDDDVPLNVVQEKAKINTGAQQRVVSASTSAQPPRATQRANPDIDLFGDSHEAPMPQQGTLSNRPPPTPPKVSSPTARTTRAGESLLGFDFFGDTQAPPPRPSSAAASISSSTAPSRPDLKQSILSLYASAPKPSTPPVQSTGTAAIKGSSPTSGFGSLNDDFKSLNFGGSPAAQAAIPGPRSSSATPSYTSPKAVNSIGGSGGFFDSLPSPPTTTTTSTSTAPPPAPQRGFSSSSGFGDFAAATSPGPSSSTVNTSSNGLSDLIGGFGSTSPTATKPTASEPIRSPFNLSSPTPTAAPKPAPPPVAPPVQTSGAIMSDPWGSNEAWASSTTTATTTTSQPPSRAPAMASPSAGAEDWGWSQGGGTTTTTKTTSRPTHVTADEDFGGWESSTVASPTAQTRPTATQPSAPKPLSNFSTNTDDLFSNVWE